jgi:hypothetical protein
MYIACQETKLTLSPIMVIDYRVVELPMDRRSGMHYDETQSEMMQRVVGASTK